MNKPEPGLVPRHRVIKHLDANLLAAVDKNFKQLNKEVSIFVSQQNLFSRLNRHKTSPMYAKIGVDLKKLLELITKHKNEMLQEMSFHEVVK